MPGPPVVEVAGDTNWPERVDAIVVGGGIVGTSTALELADQGLSVALCEKGGIGHEQSSRNWGWVRAGDRDTRELPLMMHALDLWDSMHQRTGRDVGFVRSGITFAIHSDQEAAHLEHWRRTASELGVVTEMLTETDLAHAFPDAPKTGFGAMVTPFDGRAEPQKAAPAIAEAVRARGGQVLTGCAVRGFETTAGRVSAVVTEHGPIACEAAVIAGGAWSKLLCRQQGMRFPQLNILNAVVRTQPMAGGPEGAFWSEDFAFRKRQDGGYTIANGSANIVDLVPDSLRYGLQFTDLIRANWASMKLRLGRQFLAELPAMGRGDLDRPGPFERTRVLDPRPSKRFTVDLLRQLGEQWPYFAQATIAQAWAGYIDMTPDEIPVISPLDDVPGLFLASGFSGHGFGLGPGAGRLAADLVTGNDPIVDPTPFRFSRFSDGSRIDVHGGRRAADRAAGA